MKKSLLFVLAPVAIGIAFASCNNGSAGLEQPPAAEYLQPVIQPLKFSKPKKFNWDTIKAVKVNPVVKKLNWDKLPETSYDTSGFKPFKYPVEETKFDYNSLPEKDLDIDKLPSRPLKFNSYILPPPKLIKGAKPEFKNGNLFLFGFGEAYKAPGVNVRYLLTDHSGFLWIATTKGLYRYDGENLLLFLAFHDGIFIEDMLQDYQGNIWLSFDGQIAVIDPVAGIMKIPAVGKSMRLDINVLNLIQDKQQRIWAKSFHGSAVYIIDLKAQTVKLLDKAHGLFACDGVDAIMEDKNDNIWIGGANIIDLKNKKVKHLGKINGLKSDSVEYMICDRKGRLWLGIYGGCVNVVDLKKNSIQTIREAQSPAPEMYVMGLVQDTKGKIWVGTYVNGVTIIDPEKDMVKRMGKNNGLISDIVESINRDSQGMVWIATIKGLNMIGDGAAVVGHIGKDTVNSLMEDGRGFIWDANTQGVDVLNRKTGISKHIGVKQGLGNNDAHMVCKLNEEIAIATDSGWDLIDTTRKTITHFDKKKFISNQRPHAILVDRSGRIWFGENFGDGIDVYDPKNKTLKHLGQSLGLSNGSIDDMCLDKQGQVLVSTRYGGIERIDPNTGIIQHLRNNAQGLQESGFKQFLLDNKGNVWIGSFNGLYMVNLENQKFISISKGLINERILSLIQRDGCVYAGTNQGLSVITLPAGGVNSNKNWKVRSYGLSKIQIDNVQADLITKDGLYWSGDIGITVLDVSKKDTFKSTTYITGISFFDHPVQFTDQARLDSSVKDTLWDVKREKYYLKGQTPANLSYGIKNGLNWHGVAGPGNLPVNLQLPYNQNFIQFHYSSFNFTPHDSTSYRYILIGTDKQWSGITTEGSTINYMNLQPGNYTFEVSSLNLNNVWSKPAKFSFTINPPWWQTWWAYLLDISLFAGVVWGFVTLRSRQLVKEKRILEHKVYIRTEEVMQQKEEIETQRDNLEVQRNSLENTLKELKSTQTQLIQSEKMASLGELTAGIAHEIQNPLNFVNNFSEVNTELIGEMKQEIEKGDLKEIKALATDIEENSKKINMHGKRADAIVKGMLQHSQSGSGAKEPTNINALADEYMRLAYHGLRAKDKSFNAEMITHFDPKLPKVNVIPQDIGRVLLNLFNNAFYAVNKKQKTTGENYKAEVSVSTSLENGQVVIRVKDNGVGIPDAIKDKIMQPFFTTKPTGEGTGLGLSLAYDMVVKGHGGNIIVNSKEGEGSEFIISLPVS